MSVVRTRKFVRLWGGRVILELDIQRARRPLPDPTKPSSDGVATLARELLGAREQVASDEEWIAAVAEAEAAYVPPPPESPITAAARRASGHLDGDEAVEQVRAFDAAKRTASDDPESGAQQEPTRPEKRRPPDDREQAPPPKREHPHTPKETRR